MEANYHGSLRDTLQSTLGAFGEQELKNIECDFVAAQEPLYESVAAHIFPDALALADRAHARGKQQVIVTNRGHQGRARASPRSIVERSELRRLISHVICGDDSAYQKPDPAVLGGLGGAIVGAETVVIDDQHVGSKFARRLGAAAILVCRNGSLPPHMDEIEDWQSHTRIVRSLEEVDV